MEKIEQPQYLNPVKGEHLRDGVRPIIACLENIDEDKKEFSEFDELVFSDNTHGIKNVNYYGKPENLEGQGFKNAGTDTFVISTIDNANKFSKSFKNCTGVIIAGQDKETGKDVSFMSHEDPDFFIKRKLGSERFSSDFKSQLLKMKETCVPRTIDAVVMGGNYYVNVWNEKIDKERRDTYTSSIEFLAKEIQDILGFEPTIITGPKVLPGEEHLFYENAERRLHIFRPRTGDETSISYAPKDFAEQEKEWAKSPNKPRENEEKK